MKRRRVLEGDLFTVYDAAKYLDRSPSMVRKYFDQGELPLFRGTVSGMLLFTESALARLAEKIEARARARRLGRLVLAPRLNCGPAQMRLPLLPARFKMAKVVVQEATPKRARSLSKPRRVA